MDTHTSILDESRNYSIGDTPANRGVALQHTLKLKELLGIEGIVGI